LHVHRYGTTNVPFEYSTATAIKAPVLFLHSPLVSSYSIKISIKIFGSGSDGYEKFEYYRSHRKPVSKLT